MDREEAQATTPSRNGALLPPRTPHAFRLTDALVATHGGAQPLCLAGVGVGRRWGLYSTRPGAEYVSLLSASTLGIPLTAAPSPPPVLRVDIRGPIDEAAGAPGPCEEWVDGNDAISERLCAAFAEGDVLLCVHSPGGNPAGAPEGIRRALEAKVANGRRCIVHSEGMVASLAMWWALALGDEAYGTSDSRWGSIGCRGMHAGIAGALAQEGVVPTFSAWPDDGKLAGVAELPLSEIGKARNDAEVERIGVAFAEACCTGPIGMRLGLTIDSIRALHADVFPGTAAVGTLIDGLATVEECAADMLTAATSGGTGESTMTTRAEGGGPPPGEEKDPDSTRAGMKPDPNCKNCGMANHTAAKFCNQCGKTMAAEPLPKDGDAPESSMRLGAIAARRESPMLASVPALRTALATSDALLNTVAHMVGAKTHAEITGALEATCADAGKARRYRGERNEARAVGEVRERMDLLAALYTQDPTGHPRGKLVVDITEDVEIDGKRVARVVGMKPAAQWGDGPEGRTLANLRAYTRSTLATAAPLTETPYGRPPLEASETEATRLAAAPQIAGTKQAPGVRAAVKAGVPQDDAAAIFAREFGRTA